MSHRRYLTQIKPPGSQKFILYTEAVTPSTFDPSWAFSDASVMTVDWGDGSPIEGHATGLSHTYAAGSGRKRVILSCPDWSKLTNLDVNTDSCRGVLPNFDKYNLVSLDYFYGQQNQFSGMPQFTSCAKLRYVDLDNNRLVGSIPSLATATTYLTNARFDTNLLTGTIPSFAQNTNLLQGRFEGNSLTGTIPSFALNTKITYWRCDYNKITGYTVGGFATQKSLATLNLGNCYLTQAAVDAILADCVISLGIPGRVTCTVSLNGTWNSYPSAAGLADRATLVAAGWTVNVNTSPLIAVIGDSISISTSWPTNLEADYKPGAKLLYTHAIGGAPVVYTPAVSPSCMADETALPHNTDYVVILMGINDTEYGAPFQAAYEAGVAQLKVNNPSATIWCLAILDNVGWATYHCAAKNALIQAAATAQGVTFVDTTGWIDYTTDCIGDGVHLNAAGKLKVSNQLIALLPV